MTDRTPASLLTSARRIVVKIGSALVVGPDGAPRTDWLDALAAELRGILDRGQDILIVTSGAVGMGRKALNISPKARPGAIPLARKQAAAAVGQFYLFSAWKSAFSAQNLTAAQILLTTYETENRRMHLNARATIHTLLSEKIVPIVNENDTVSTGELRYGDNDRLAARVAQMIESDLLVILSTTDGLYTADPTIHQNAAHIPFVDQITQTHVEMAGDATPGLSTGGMRSKLEAARLVTRSGTAMMIAKGMDLAPLTALAGNALRATVFAAQGSPQSARKRWIQGSVKPRGALYVDEGARRALEGGSSLLPVGVRKIEGTFDRGDAVRILTESGVPLGIGLCAYNSEDARKIAGRRSEDILIILGYAGRDEMVNRDDLALQKT
ncbi:MAG: glutamate 5-kinase [Rhodospirillales bacterium]|nr:glutamate 5-kinase [Rhodospirillales bacterium]